MADNETLFIKSKRFLTEMFGGNYSQEKPLHGSQENWNKDLIYGASMYDTDEVNNILNLGEKSKKDTGEMSDMMTFLKETVASSSAIAKETEELIGLSPDLKQAGNLLIASILSPDDLQNNSLKFNCNTPLLSDATNKLISELITEHMCETRKLHKLLPKWLYNILLGPGSVPILTLPNSNNRVLNELFKQTEIVKQHSIDGETLEYRRNKSNTIPIDDFKYSLFSQCKTPSLNSFSDIVLTKKENNFYEYVNEVYKAFPDNEDLYKDENLMKDVTPMLHAMDSNNNIIVSDNFYTFQKNKKKIEKAKKNINNILEKRFQGANNEIFNVDDSLSLVTGDHPGMFILDPNMVIPITIPGSNNEHVGYFVIVDENSNQYTGMEHTFVNNPTSGDVASNTIHVAFNGSKTAKNLSGDNKRKYAESIFNVALKQMINSKLTDIGLDGSKLEMFNNVSRFLFDTFVSKNKIRLVFVPAQLVTYLALQHRKDGTGKSRLEDGAKLILALKNTLIVSNVMKAMSNSMPQKTISVDVPPETVNVTSLFEDIYNIYSQKKTFNPMTNPVDISKGIADQHLTIDAKNIPGIKGLDSVEESSKSSSGSDENESLIDRLDRQSCTCIGVPHHAMNMLGESEFARSITSNNLLFSASVRTDQKTLTELLTNLCRNEVTYSEPIQRKLIEFIKKDSNVAADLMKDGKKGAKNNESAADDGQVVTSPEIGSYTENDENSEKVLNVLKDVISNIVSTLPAPNMVVDNARFEELDKFISILDRVSSITCSSDLLAIDDRDLEKVLTASKAQVMKTIMNRFMSEQGYDDFMGINMKEFDVTEASDLYLYTKNTITALQDAKKLIDAKRTAEGESDSGGSSW